MKCMKRDCDTTRAGPSQRLVLLPWSSSPGLPQLVLQLQVSDGGQVDLVRPVGDAQRPGVHIPADVTHVTPCTIADYGEFRSTLQCFSLVK